jgi:hypothetical protein
MTSFGQSRSLGDCNEIGMEHCSIDFGSSAFVGDQTKPLNLSRCPCGSRKVTATSLICSRHLACRKDGSQRPPPFALAKTTATGLLQQRPRRRTAVQQNFPHVRMPTVSG